MTDERVIPLVDEGLGNSSYLVDLGDGRALAVDPCRDGRALRSAVARRGLRVAFAADTHLHADFLTGAMQLAASDGAQLLAAAAGDRTFDHHGLRDGDEVDLGGLRLRALATPGHTDEHLTFLLLDGEQPLGVFTGGSLIVGAAARTDLVDPARAEELARAQWRSIQRLMALPDATSVWPTHGAGSFCSAPPGADRTSTIGRERITNPLLQSGSEQEFVEALLDSLGSYPPYFQRLGEINRLGPATLPPVLALEQLDAPRVVALRAAGTAIVDVRPIERFAARHIPGSLSIELREAFATWLGWLVPFGSAPVVLRDPEQDPDEIAWQAAKIGYEIAGELAGGLEAWVRAGHPVTSTSLVRPAELEGAHVLDIRQNSEFIAGHVPGARHVELGAVVDHVGSVSERPMVVMCGHGERAMTAASLLEAAGDRSAAVLLGGPRDWAEAHGKQLATGP